MLTSIIRSEIPNSDKQVSVFKSFHSGSHKNNFVACLDTGSAVSFIRRTANSKRIKVDKLIYFGFKAFNEVKTPTYGRIKCKDTINRKTRVCLFFVVSDHIMGETSMLIGLDILRLFNIYLYQEGKRIEKKKKC